ncbi:MAG: N-acetylneuraminate synthase [bacterium]|nr:N-acetylneuraminate synthase [bacterium]
MTRKNKIKIGHKFIGTDQPVFIIAEAGVNHNHRLDLALELVDAAADVRADAVKFQTFRAEQVVTEAGVMAEYQKKNIGKTESQLDMLRKLEFSESWYPKVIAHCKKRGIIFLSTPHGSFDSIDLLQKLGVPAFKFGSGDLTTLPILEYAAKLNKPIILGTGMATMAEVKEAVGAIKKAGNSQIVMLHCTTNYPCPPEEVNLRAMQTMMRELDVLVGYSDHTLGSQVPVMAVTLDACVIEKHLTLDNDLPGPDHKASANPTVFKKMVDEIRQIETIMGSPIKRPLPGEVKLQSVVRRSIVVIRDIKRRDKFSRQNIDLKRPGTGLEPKYFSKVIGKKAAKDIKSGVLLDRNFIS